MTTTPLRGRLVQVGQHVALRRCGQRAAVRDSSGTGCRETRGRPNPRSLRHSRHAPRDRGRSCGSSRCPRRGCPSIRRSACSGVACVARHVLLLAQACAPTVTGPTVSSARPSRIVPTLSASCSSSLRDFADEPAQRFDGERDLLPGPALVPHPGDHAVDEQDREVAGLAAGERALARLVPDRATRAGASRRRTRRSRAAAARRDASSAKSMSPALTQAGWPSSCTSVSGRFCEQRGCPRRRCGQPLREVRRSRWAVCVQVARGADARAASGRGGCSGSQRRGLL